MQQLDSSADFDATRDEEFLAAVPGRSAVFVVEPRAELTGAQPFLLRSANLRERLRRLLGPPEPASKRLNLRECAARVARETTIDVAVVDRREPRVIHDGRYVECGQHDHAPLDRFWIKRAGQF